MLHTHLENFKSDQPIIAVSLEAQPVRPAQQQFGLFETALRDPHQLYETLARLTALLGKDRVGTPVLEETHRPDAFHIEPFSWQWHEQPGPNDTMPSCALRRFRPNLPAAVLLDEARPVHMRSGPMEGEVADQKGPYAISGNWWDETHWARCEWDVQLANGVLARCHQTESGWLLDGIYD
jgi:protein ImuB